MKKLLALLLLLCLTACDGELKMSDLAGKFAGQAPINRYFGQINTQHKTFKTGPDGKQLLFDRAK